MNSLVKRSLFGILFLAVMLGGLLWNQTAFFVLFLLIGAQMLREFYRMNLGGNCRLLQGAGLLYGTALFVLGYFYFQGVLALRIFAGVAFAGLLVLLCLSVFQKDHLHFPKLAFILAGLAYISLPLALAPAVVFRGAAFSGTLMLCFFILIWSSDVGAYCFGMALGQKLWPAKMCPAISPKKSWAGFIGGLLLTLLAAWILQATGLMSLPLLHCLAAAALIHVTGVLGDLFESLWKRAAGIKDSGNVIPGHGGLMDRFDSSLFAIPAAYLYLLFNHLV